jgi:hypothetical protein
LSRASFETAPVKNARRSIGKSSREPVITNKEMKMAIEK